jgi:hypothetical protein
MYVPSSSRKNNGTVLRSVDMTLLGVERVRTPTIMSAVAKEGGKEAFRKLKPQHKQSLLQRNSRRKAI